MKRSVIVLALLLALWSLLLASCLMDKHSADLEGVTWVLESYGPPSDPKPVLANKDVTAEFVGDDAQVGGSAGCNRYFAEYKARGGKLSVGVVGQTEMYCMDPEGVMDQEQEYLSALGAAESYEIQDGRLRITCSGGDVLVFRALD